METNELPGALNVYLHSTCLLLFPRLPFYYWKSNFLWEVSSRRSFTNFLLEGRSSYHVTLREESKKCFCTKSLLWVRHVVKMAKIRYAIWRSSLTTNIAIEKVSFFARRLSLEIVTLAIVAFAKRKLLSPFTLKSYFFHHFPNLNSWIFKIG